jgi:hypothetical protein
MCTYRLLLPDPFAVPNYKGFFLKKKKKEVLKFKASSPEKKSQKVFDKRN